MKTFYTHANDPDYGSLLFDESQLYQKSEPQKKHLQKPTFELTEPIQPMFIMEVKIQDGLIDLPIY